MKTAPKTCKAGSRAFGTSKKSSLSVGTRVDLYRYCALAEKDPVNTLKTISVNVLYVFFDWLIEKRKDTLGAASTLQTYWNVFCLVRKKETGYHMLDPLIKSQMHGVCSLCRLSLVADRF